MTEFGVTLIWCAGQVALVGGLALIAHNVLRSYGRSVAPVISLTALVVSIWLAGTAFGPWPSYLDWVGSEEIANVLKPDVETASGILAPTAESPISTVAADTLRTTLLELAPAESQSLIAAWPWARVVSMLFLMGLAVGALQLVIGLIVVQTRLRRSHPLRDRSLVRLVEQLREDMGCTRSIELRVSYDLASAATVGWSEPVILLPADWRSWTTQERRAVLAHEIAHIVHNDYLAVVMSQVGLALHFYHPIVHWLSARMRLEQEFAADAVAAEYVGGRREYLKTLAMMALRQSNQAPMLLARGFLPEKGMFLKRIEMLRDSRRPTRPLSSGKQAALVVALLLAGLFVSGLRGPNSSQAWARPLLETPTPRSMSVEPAKQSSIFIEQNKKCAPSSNQSCPTSTGGQTNGAATHPCGQRIPGAQAIQGNNRSQARASDKAAGSRQAGSKRSRNLRPSNPRPGNLRPGKQQKGAAGAT